MLNKIFWLFQSIYSVKKTNKQPNTVVSSWRVSYFSEIVTHTALMIYPCRSEENQWEIWCQATLTLDPAVLNMQNMTNQSQRPPDTTKEQ